MEQRKKVLVLDTSALILGFDSFSVTDEQLTIPLVLDELLPQSNAYIRLKMAIEYGRVKLCSPPSDFIKKVEIASKRTGDLCSLSKVDRQILALSLLLRKRGFYTTIVTDDYSIQNVADYFDLHYVTLATFGIRYRFNWILYCPACYKKYFDKASSEQCIVCGTKLKRKVIRKTRAQGKERSQK